MDAFTYTALPSRVIFGLDTLDRIGPELARLGARRALVLCTPPQETSARRLMEALGGGVVGVYSAAAMHTPIEVTEDALLNVRRLTADCVISLGGGSAIGLGKAIALRTDLPQIAVPTTYAGSEATPIIGETVGGRKTVQRTPKVLPEVIVYDVRSTMSLPARLSAVSGLNAIAHAVEALYAEESNPVTSVLAENGIRALSGALPTIMRSPDDASARSDALYGAWACGTCLGSVGMALHHKLCHVLGGSFELPHAETHASVLPHAVAYNAPATPVAMRTIARSLEAADAAGALYDLASTLRVPLALRDIGMPESGLDDVVAQVLESAFYNPRPIERDALRALLDNAFFGRRPAEAENFAG